MYVLSIVLSVSKTLDSRVSDRGRNLDRVDSRKFSFKLTYGKSLT